MGLEYGQECFCGNVLAGSDGSSESREAEEEECDMKCAGDGRSKCGSGDRLSVYKTNVPVSRAHIKRGSLS